ncbi:MAG: peptide MFS transporter [Flavobacteriales bacterium]|nr:peptide MFS transporter [Flavobacteriales bacterium]MCB9167535.1 peptide MFS transporter [Flavobacteriales bacterium]
MSQGKHPRGLYLLFFTEMWERFGYYLMLGILFLYMVGGLDGGGLGLEESAAHDIYGTYIALVYLTPFVGGLLADRVFGYRRTIIFGGATMAAGYLTLAIPGQTAFFVALALVIIGNGFFKPNISTLLGNLYNKPEYVKLKDRGYNIFYMGINVGAFICNFIAAWLRNSYGWGYAFAAAGVGMLIGLAIFISGKGVLGEADQLKPVQKEDMPLRRIYTTIFLPVLLFGVLGYFAAGLFGMDDLLGSRSNDVFLFACIPVVYFYLSTYLKASAEDKQSIGSLLYIFGVVIVFWAIFHQNGNVLTEWAEKYTDRQVPEAMTGVVSTIRADQTVHAPAPGEQADAYLANLPAADQPSTDRPLHLVSTEIFQSLNPMFVVLLTPLILALWGFLGRRNTEPSTPGKIALGLFITGLSTLVMIMAVKASGNGATKVSAWWLIGTYAVITFGELCLSPMGLSLVSKLSPQRLTALMMGGWFLSTSIGNKLSGVLGHLGSDSDDRALVFYMNFAGAMASALLLFLAVKRIRGVMIAKTGHT